MNRKTALIIIFSSILLVVFYLVVINLILNHRRYNWVPYQYTYSSKQPYETKYLYKTIEKNHKRKKFKRINQRITAKLDTNATSENYIFIGREVFYDSLEIEHLLKYVSKGNKVLIASEIPPLKLLSGFTNNNIELYTYHSHYDTLAKANFMDGGNDFEYIFKSHKGKTGNFSWHGLEESYFDNAFEFYGYKKLGMFDSSLVNFYSMKHGNGKIFFHTCPLLFTNYYFITEEGYNYVNRVLSKMEDGPVAWDHYSRYPHFVNQDSSQPIYSGGPLSYILSQKSLMWAYYLLIAMLILFILFRSKREQKIIPLVPQNKNTSIEFVKAVGTVHYRSGEHKSLAKEITKQYYVFLRNRYGIATNVQDKLQLQKIVVLKSGISQQHVQKIFHQDAKIKHYTSDIRQELIELYLAINYFYKNCK
jgi:hypothetical protein